MKTVLAFGDSLTYGHNAETGLRHDFADRWPVALEAGLDSKARVIGDGLNGRTTAFDDYTDKAERNGARLLPTALSVNDPVDVVIIMLGTNDLKPFVAGTAKGAATGMRKLAETVMSHPYAGRPLPRKLVIVAPPLCGPSDEPGGLPAQDRLISESEKVAGLYRQIADEFGATFFNAADVASPIRFDGVHLDAAATRAIGAALVPIVSQLLDIA